MQIGELANACGLSREALRFYEKQGLIGARRLANGYRDYPAETAMLVHYIRTAQQLGFTLAEIGQRLPRLWEQADAGPLLAAALQEKLADIDARIVALSALRQDLATRLASACPLQPHAAAG
ncbi:MerR family transcriptional regulator [Stenotrophomonas sp. ESTM1D_MKCIP4_1]|uniref:MerR family transcriptional regulator n=1 Tax=Stenotrophomonas sp. ESTM1D_MKCIP4_1 TaxID=2072414 RepID=UPI000D53E379|nr:MerR family transcriptional regulator [Stenotrophomonas sp. ESTM1D_MKCIP4_1]AWH54295.1 MerR family transcriptional regulator [Stenotrophomonas sp. ESTM1D_MKCIP4_1]